MRTWNYSRFSVDQSVLLRAGDQAGIERLVQYMTRCPFSLSRLVKVTENGQVVYKVEKQACRAFPDQQGDGIASGTNRNFQVFSALDFLAEVSRTFPKKVNTCCGTTAGTHTGSEAFGPNVSKQTSPNRQQFTSTVRRSKPPSRQPVARAPNPFSLGRC